LFREEELLSGGWSI